MEEVIAYNFISEVSTNCVGASRAGVIFMIQKKSNSFRVGASESPARGVCNLRSTFHLDVLLYSCGGQDSLIVGAVSVTCIICLVTSDVTQY